MSIFGLFQSPEWARFKAFPLEVQQDIAALLALDSLAKTSISSELKKANASIKGGRNSGNPETPSSGTFADVLRSITTSAGELQICLLATGVGKVLEIMKWNVLPPERAIGTIGLLAMCEFRNLESLDSDITLDHCGYSSDPDEARTQFLVQAGNTARVANFRWISEFLDEVFLGRWHQLRIALFEVNPRQIGQDTTLLSQAKGLLRSLSPARKQLMFSLGDALEKKLVDRPKGQGGTKATGQFDADQYRREHAFLHVPYLRLVSLMERASSDIENTFRALAIDEYELRRMVSAKDQLTSAVLTRLVLADSNILGYSILMAAAIPMDEKFVGCGVWKAVTKAFEDKSLLDFKLIADNQAYGMLGDARMEIVPSGSRDNTLAVNHMVVCRKASGNFLGVTSSHRHEHLDLLFAGTAILRHVLNHPQFGQVLASMALRLISALGPLLVELKREVLTSWDQQKDL